MQLYNTPNQHPASYRDRGRAELSAFGCETKVKVPTREVLLLSWWSGGRRMFAECHAASFHRGRRSL
ncbi:hypothetical protein AV530_007702 [Patagioenas fasciata monilis]|uniref:Uncharacterized protein n=1 Tax=Patagioenas fasciata monilis TaxID=372326 RepID=A0A1V4JYW2_PATFA|nr:hypothetical protein AV530_007702 [Patagioenas fasciata monilis]